MSCGTRRRFWSGGGASIFFVCVFLLFYRPEFLLFKYVAYTLFLALLAGLNGLVHYRLAQVAR